MQQERTLGGYPSIDRPWLRYYSDEAISAPLPECSIYEYLWENNRDFPDDVAIVYFSRKITYRELFENIERTAKAFSALGVGPGEVVTIALPSIPEALYAVYALNRLGAVANMVHPLAGEAELVGYLNEVHSRVAVVFDGTYRIIEGAVGQTHVEHAVVVTAGESLPPGLKLLYGLRNRRPRLSSGSVFQSWGQFVGGGRDAEPGYVDKDVDSAAIISHTGGTTGEPKGVMCSDRNVNALIWQLGVLSHKRGDRNLVVLPPFVNYSLVDGMIGMVTLGIQAVLIPDYKPERIAQYIRRYRPNHISSIPAYWEAVLSLKSIGKDDFSSLQHIYYGGEAMDVDKERQVNEDLVRHGAKSVLHKGLGSTELVSAATMTYDDCNMPGSAGAPLVKVNCSIVEPGTTRELGYNQEGEICFSGPTLMLGYYGKQDATDDVVKVHPDGGRWLHTGDLGYVDEDGVVFVTGRIKRIIMTKGADGNISKLFPARIERAVGAHPSVRACCVVGVPNERRINYPKAVVELNESYTATPQLAFEIRNSCKGKLPEYMVPEAVEFIDALPRTDRGKVDYRAVEERAK